MLCRLPWHLSEPAFTSLVTLAFGLLFLGLGLVFLGRPLLGIEINLNSLPRSSIRVVRVFASGLVSLGLVLLLGSAIAFLVSVGWIHNGSKTPLAPQEFLQRHQGKSLDELKSDIKKSLKR